MTKLEESKKPDISLNIVVKNLTFNEGENITDRVNGLLKEGVKLRNVKVAKEVRKQSYRDNMPGIVIATLHNKEDK